MMESDQGELPVFGTMIVYVCGSISVNMEEEWGSPKKARYLY